MAETYNATSIHQFNNGKLLIGLLEIEEGEIILDVGAGTGQLGAYVAQLVAGLEENDFAQFRRTLVKLLEAKQTDGCIQLERHLVFITASRPGQA